MNLVSEDEIEEFSQKNTYTVKEKEYIMKMLNDQRLEDKKKDTNSFPKIQYTDEEKKNILQSINDKRLEKNLYAEMDKKRVENKKIYTFAARDFYKFLHMDREFFIEIKDLEYITSRPSIVTLYYRTFGELKKRDFLIKIEPYSHRIFISSDVIRVYFKGFSLDENR